MNQKNAVLVIQTHSLTKKDYTCSDDFNKSFCYDGFIEYNKDYEKTILFILREANISDKLKGKELHPETDYNYFYMKKNGKIIFIIKLKPNTQNSSHTG